LTLKTDGQYYKKYIFNLFLQIRRKPQIEK